MPRIRVVNQHLKRRGKIYWLRKRVPQDLREPVGKDWIEFSLQTSSVSDARARRNREIKRLEAEWDVLRNGDANGILDAYDAYTDERRADLTSCQNNGAPRTVELLVDKLDAAAERWGVDQGLLRGTSGPPKDWSTTEQFDKVRDRYVEETQEGRQFDVEIRAAQGQLPTIEAGKRWLDAGGLAEGTKREYRRAIERASKCFPFVAPIQREDARLYIQALAETGGLEGEGVSASTVGNHQAALFGLWEYHGKGGGVWRNIKLAIKKKAVKRDIWSMEETKHLLDEASKQKLRDAIWIALHTGARASEIAGMRYDAENDWLIIPRNATKTDAGERALPCPDDIRENVQRWVATPWRGQTLSNRFSELKNSLGYGKQQVLHSFRHTLLSRLHELQIPEATAALVAGHEYKGLTYGTYGNKIAIESLRPIMNQLNWKALLAEL